MDQENYTKEDINNIKQITEINGNVTSLKEDMRDVKSTLKEINNSLPAIRNDLNQALTLGQENKLTSTALGVRVTSLENKDVLAGGKKEGLSWAWRIIIAVVTISLFAMNVATFVINLGRINGN